MSSVVQFPARLVAPCLGCGVVDGYERLTHDELGDPWHPACFKRVHGVPLEPPSAPLTAHEATLRRMDAAESYHAFRRHQQRAHRQLAAARAFAHHP